MLVSNTDINYDDKQFLCADILLANLAALLGVAVVLAFGQPLLAIAFLPLALLYRWLQARPGCRGNSCE